MALVAAVLFPCAVLLPINGEFQTDWHISVWLSGYLGLFFRQHGYLPAVLNTHEAVGIPLPLFYGQLLYQIFGVFSAWIHPQVVLRAAIVALLALQTYCVRRGFLAVGAPRRLATAIAVLVCWAIYPLTNLYNRAAIMEFFGVGFLTCAFSCWFWALGSDPSAERGELERKRGLLLTGLFLALTAGAHPITALYGGVIFLLLLPTLRVLRKNDFGVLALSGALALGAVSPWLYATLRYRKDLVISIFSSALGSFPGSLDWWAIRFLPIPFDVRASQWPDVAWLDAQVNFPLLLLVLLLIPSLFFALTKERRKKARWALFPLSAGFVFFTVLSMDVDLFDHLPSVFRMIQWIYRAVSYQNACLLLLLFVAFLHTRSGTHPAQSRETGASFLEILLIGFCLVLSGAGVKIKLSHAMDVFHAEGEKQWLASDDFRGSLAHQPAQLYEGDYTTPFLLEKWPGSERGTQMRGFTFEVGDSDDFGKVRPVLLDLPQAAWVRTSVAVFPWNRLWLDGRLMPDGDLRSLMDPVPPGQLPHPWEALRVPEGRHQLEYRFMPDLLWRALHVLSYGVFPIWAGLLAGCSIPFHGPWNRLLNPWSRDG